MRRSDPSQKVTLPSVKVKARGRGTAEGWDTGINWQEPVLSRGMGRWASRLQPRVNGTGAPLGARGLLPAPGGSRPGRGLEEPQKGLSPTPGHVCRWRTSIIGLPHTDNT